MKLSWNEPKWSCEPRRKERAKALIKSTSWLRVAFWLFIFLPASVYILLQIYPNRNFHWYLLPFIFIVGGLPVALLHFLSSKDHTKITIDDEGIRMQGPEDNIFKKYYYDKIASIELVSDIHNNYSLSWHYEGKNIIRGISQEIDITRLKMIIESNSNLELKMREP